MEGLNPEGSFCGFAGLVSLFSHSSERMQGDKEAMS